MITLILVCCTVSKLCERHENTVNRDRTNSLILIKMKIDALNEIYRAFNHDVS